MFKSKVNLVVFLILGVFLVSFSTALALEAWADTDYKPFTQIGRSLNPEEKDKDKDTEEKLEEKPDANQEDNNNDNDNDNTSQSINAKFLANEEYAIVEGCGLTARAKRLKDHTLSYIYTENERPTDLLYDNVNYRKFETPSSDRDVLSMECWTDDNITDQDKTDIVEYVREDLTDYTQKDLDKTEFCETLKLLPQACDKIQNPIYYQNPANPKAGLFFFDDTSLTSTQSFVAVSTKNLDQIQNITFSKDIEKPEKVEEYVLNNAISNDSCEVERVDTCQLQTEEGLVLYQLDLELPFANFEVGNKTENGVYLFHIVSDGGATDFLIFEYKNNLPEVSRLAIYTCSFNGAREDAEESCEFEVSNQDDSVSKIDYNQAISQLEKYGLDNPESLTIFLTE